MTTQSAASAGPIHLNFKSVQQVVVQPADEDRFMMTVKEAVRACEFVEKGKDLRESFSRLFVYLHNWSEKRASDIDSVYVYPGDGTLNVLICTRGEGYRFDLDDQVTELDLDLTRQFTWLNAEVIQVPEGAREGNVALEKAIIVYGDGSPAREPSRP